MSRTGSDGAWRSHGDRALRISCLALVYFAAAKMGLRLAVVHPSATAVWPPTAIAIAALLVFSTRLWPGVFAGAFLANITTAGSVLTSLGIATGNTLEAVLGVWFIRRFARSDDPFGRPGDVLRYVALVAGASTLVSATAGVTSLSIAGYSAWPRFVEVWSTWWLGDAMAALVVGPALILWAAAPRLGRVRRPAESACAVLGFAASGVLFFRPLGAGNAPLAWIWLPVLLWVAYRFGRRAAATTVLAMAAVTIVGTVRGAGPFHLPSANASLLLLQAFLGVASVTTLTISAVVASHRRAVEALATARDELEARVRDRTRALEAAKESLESEVSLRRGLQMDLIDAGDAERVRLGRDLHDGLGQVLAGIGFLTSALKRKVAARETVTESDAGEIQDQAREAIEATRRIATDLTSVSLGSGGLRVAIEDLATMTERVFDLECTVSCDPTVHVERDLAATNLYRIAQEAVTNAARHGGGDRIRISLTLDGPELCLRITDNGAGIGRAEPGRSGLGLRIMESRADSLGGRLTIESNGEGTTVTCVVPNVARRVGTASASSIQGDTPRGPEPRDPTGPRRGKGAAP